MTDSQGKNLIFLISQPRAGSTLLQLLLAGHPDIATTSEPWIALHPVFALRKNGIETVYNSGKALDALKEFLQQSGVDKGFYQRQIASFLLSFYNQAAGHQGKRFFLDKTPRYYLVITELMELFPGAKFIILFRNPLSVLNSILKTWIKNDLSLLGEYRSDLMAAPQILADNIKKYPGRCFKVKYDELVANPEHILKDICRFLEISYSDSMTDYSNRLRPEWQFGDTVGIRKVSRPSIESLDKWKKELITPQERYLALSYLEVLGQNLIKEMGYDYDNIKSSFDVPADVNGLISLSTVMSDSDGFSKTAKVREMIKDILSDDNVWSENFILSDKGDESFEWRSIIMQASKRFSNEKIKSLINERNAMHDSLSWRITSPVRFLGRLFNKEKR